MARTMDFPEFDLFLRLWDQRKMSRTLARELLKLQFPSEDNARSHELAVMNKEGQLTPAELRELDAHVRIGLLVSILQSRARQVLDRKPGKLGVRPARA